MTPTQPFAPLLRHLLTSFGGSKKDFARALGIAPSVLSRLLHPKATGPQNILLCLRMAHVGRMNASRVLRAAGHAEAAELLEHLYGEPIETPALGAAVTAHELAHLTSWRQLPAPEARAFELLIARAINTRTIPQRPVASAARARR